MTLIRSGAAVFGALFAEVVLAQSTSQTLTIAFDLVPAEQVPLNPYATLAVSVALGIIAAATLKTRVMGAKRALGLTLAVLAASTLALYPSVAWVQAPPPLLSLQLALSISPASVVLTTGPATMLSGYNVAVVNPHPQSVRITSIDLTVGAFGLVPGGNACRAGTVLPPGGSCPSVVARPFS